MNAQDLALFESTRPALMGIACRLLRSRTEAEDAVQDCFLRWSDSDRAGIASPVGWLKTLCTRRCIDVLRTVRCSRVDYVGASLSDVAADPDGDEEIDRHLPVSLTIAFSQLLQRLSPKERAAYVLHELFEQPHRTIAATLHMTPGACQKLVERGRVHIAQQRTRYVSPADTQRRLLRAFHAAIATGNPSQLSLLLARDAHTKRGGSKARTVLRVLQSHEQPVHAPTQDFNGDHRDEISTSARADHWCKRQDGSTSQRAA